MIFEGPGGLRCVIFRSQIALGSVPAATCGFKGAKMDPRRVPERSWRPLGGEKKVGRGQEAPKMIFERFEAPGPSADLIASRIPPGQVSRSREPKSVQKEGPEGSSWSPTWKMVWPLWGRIFALRGGRFSPPRVRNCLPEASWGFLGARLASGGHFGRLWAEKGEPKNCMAGSWDRLGALLAALGPDLGRLPAPRRTPREPRGGHVWSSFQR